jgi:ComF family protein
MLDLVISLIAPHRCIKCSALGSLLCDICAIDAFTALPVRCWRCKQLSRQSKTCQTCYRASNLRYVWAVSSYEGAAKELVELLKFKNARAAAKIIALQIAQKLPDLPPRTIVVPLPTATRRIRQRGYNQAALIAKELARNHSLRYYDVLLRSGQSRQVGANRSLRQKQLYGAFMVKNNHKAVSNHPILLVDDVLTTGSSLIEATRVLRAAGHKEISAAVFCQKE